jgi:glyoxylase-like metal-dependent hydrolase (beta-lactamase superfamily II)
MRRHLSACLVIGIVCAAAVPGAAAAAEKAFVPTIAEEPLGGPLTLLQLKDAPGGHVNALLSAGADGLLLVDFAGDWQTMRCDPAAAKIFDTAIRAHGNGRIRYLLNTHWHGDHTAGNEIYGKEAVVVAHRATRAALMTRQTPHWHPDGLGPLAPHGWPAVVFDNAMSLHMNGDEVQLWHFGPAHSEGDMVVYFTGSKVAHVGDLYHGFELLSMPSDAEGMMLTLHGIASRLAPDAKIVTGHGGVTGVPEFLRYQRMYTAVLGHVRGAVAAGRPLADITAAGLPAPWNVEWKGDPAQVPMWLEAMHRSIAGASVD